ncbi:NAD(P)-binding protein [Amylostereum chailletii]|nr:NAD(P)-binding protein [Amylostereum chailletii]
MVSKVWFITGASTGFGRVMAEQALANGDNVVATLRKPAMLSDLTALYPPSRLLTLKLDVTVPQDVIDGFKAAEKAFGRIDVVFNNAGFVEGTPEEEIRRIFETNFFGAVSVSKEAVRFFREVNPSGAGGLLLQVSSLVAISPFPVSSFYSSTFSVAFAQELNPKWNIKVTILCPGPFATNVMNPDKNFFLPIHPAYDTPDSTVVSIRQQVAAHNPGGDTAKAVKKIYELSGMEKPPGRLFLGKPANEQARAVLKSLNENIDEYEAWSEGL